ncbi:MAG: serine hydrolase domain-containing protein [Deltaproteobacteria bacterium]
MNNAPAPARGTYADGFEPVVRTFAAHLASRAEIGAALTVYHRGERVVHLHGGLASIERATPFTDRTRTVLYSVTKGLASMALSKLADRGALDFDAPVATYWPGFAQGGKSAITVGQLVSHRAGLPVLDDPLSLAEHANPGGRGRLVEAMERQRPLWEPGRTQGYHATTFGMYVRELVERIAGEPIGALLAREFFEPLAADVSLGTPPGEDHRIAAVYAPSMVQRLAGMTAALARRAAGREEPLTEWRMLGAALDRGGLARRALLEPHAPRGIVSYAEPAIWRALLAWVTATGTADGVARAYLPFALSGQVEGRRYLADRTILPLYERSSWSKRDAVLQKPLGWTRGFLKDEPHLFSPVRESFGHAGTGGSLGWCDPVNGLTIGYVMNRLDWHVRSPRAIALCRALYACAPVRDHRSRQESVSLRPARGP